MNNKIIAIIQYIGINLAIIFSFSAPGASQFQYPDLARIIFWHLPCAMISVIFHLICGYHAFKIIKYSDTSSEVKMNNALGMAAMMSTLTMLTGLLFSKVQWGAWWQWDARQTSYLMLLLIFSSSLILKKGLLHHSRKAKITAVYNLTSIPVGIFLVFIYPRLTQIMQNSFHPSQTIQGGLLDQTYSFTLLFVGFNLFLLCYRIFHMKNKLDYTIIIKENNHARFRNMELHSSHTSDSYMDSPIYLSRKN